MNLEYLLVDSRTFITNEEGALKTFFGASVDSSTSYRVEIEVGVGGWGWGECWNAFGAGGGLVGACPLWSAHQVPSCRCQPVPPYHYTNLTKPPTNRSRC